MAAFGCPPRTTVTDEFKTPGTAKVRESRAVKAGAQSLTKGDFLDLLPRGDRPEAGTLIEQLETLDFELQATPSTLKYGFIAPDGEFHGLLTLGKTGAWILPHKRDRDLFDSAATRAFREASNTFGRFYKDDQMDLPDTWGCVVKYRQLAAVAPAFVAFLDDYRTKIVGMLGPVDL